MHRAIFLVGIAALLSIASACGDAPISPTEDRLQATLGYNAAPKPTGVLRSYDLVVKRAPWELLPSVTVQAITYNGTVPGPTIRVKEGDTLRVVVRNELDQDSSIHWHGLHVPNAMDGVPGVTQPPVRPGETFAYEFVAPHAGTFMYHPHINSAEQIDSGLYGLLIIDPQQPDQMAFDKEFTMMLGAWMVGMEQQPMQAMAMDYNYFTINGKAYPATEPWMVKQGDKARVRIVNISNLAHPMHLHGQDFKVIAKDGEPVPAANQQWMNTLNVAPGETYDIAFVADNPGNWVFHCHELHHTENDGLEPGGLIQLILYEGYQGYQPVTPTPMPSSMPGMRH
ncbi:MAG: multicopper oxidase domain-containing protein [Dehalococcoidia bacterium]|nr:multicopper oxidase domain-containing protein [Dehalococcoidia bacterium]